MAENTEKRRPCLVIGANGQLGRALANALRGPALVAAWRRSDLDLSRIECVGDRFRALREQGAEVVINTAAMTAVDRCEQEPERAWAINAEAPGVLAGACETLGLRFVHISTDYVFSGKGEVPWRETDPTEPASEYGKSKRAGEEKVLAASARALVVRTAWLLGDGANFVRTILAAAQRTLDGEGPPLRVVDDQRGSPTYAPHLAEGILALLEAGATGIYHLANSGVASWWDLALAALRESGLEVPVEPVSTNTFPRPAPRPAWSALDVSRAAQYGVELPPWQDGLRAYLESAASPLRGRPGG